MYWRPRLVAAAIVGLSGCDSVIEVSPSLPDATVPPGADAGSELERRFSFFVTSLSALQELSGSADGFGGDLRFGEQGAGAGLRGADKICSAIASASLPSAAEKTWRAFLSSSTEDARDRIGSGPWYDRRGRLVATTLEQLLEVRPASADRAIIDDLPNELGVPNSDPLGLGGLDNHDVLTGSDASGRRLRDAAESTCEDWTSAAPVGNPRLGHSWPRANASGSMVSWISAHDAAGCAAGLNLIETNVPLGEGSVGPEGRTVGAGGGYGAIYCFALSE